MKRYYSFLTLSVIFLFNVLVANDVVSDKIMKCIDWQKQGIRWEMTKDEAEKTIGKFFESNSDIKYGDLLGIPCRINFEYEKDYPKRMRSIEYYYPYSFYNPLNPLEYFKSYEKVEKILVERYGNATLKRTVWKNERFKNKKNKWGTALKEGDLVLYSLWKLKDQVITHILGTYESGPNIDHQTEFFEPGYYKDTFERDYSQIIKKNQEKSDKELEANKKRNIASIQQKMQNGLLPSIGNDVFYKLKWGMSPKKIVINDGFMYMKRSKDNYRIFAQTVLFGQPVEVHFLMKNKPEDTTEELCNIVYFFPDIFKKPEGQLADFKKINSILTKKYGKPSSQSIMLKDISLKFEPDNYISAFEGGDLRYRWEWRTRKMSISHKIMWRDTHSMHDIYISQ